MRVVLLAVAQGGRATSAHAAAHSLRHALPIAAGLGLVAGFWCVSAFTETEKYFCVVAPVFVALSVLMAANCLASVPHIATTAVIGAFTPIAVKMLIFDNLGIRCIAVMMIVISAMQLRLVYSKFDETVQMLALQKEMRTQAETDPLTRICNRRTFNETLAELLERPGAVASLAMIDLDGFKPANDTYGHHAGDMILIEVANRLQQLFPDAACVARLGGDEFAVLHADGLTGYELARTIRAMLSLPYEVGGAVINISASVGTAKSPEKGNTISTLLQSADVALYADKSQRRIAQMAA